MGLPLTSSSSVTTALLFIVHQPELLQCKMWASSAIVSTVFGIVRMGELLAVSLHP